MDGRSAEARFAREIRTALLDDLGRQPTTAEQVLIGLIAFKALRCQLLAQRVLKQKELDAGLDHHMLSWANSMRRDLETIGVAPSRPPAPSLAQYLLERRGAT